MSLDVKDAAGVTKTLKTTLASGEHTPHHQIDGTVAVSGPLTDSELRASAVPVSVSGVSTAANQATANSSLSSIDGKLPALSGGRVPVDIGGSGSITITSGTVTVSNEVEVKNDSSNPLPVSGTVSSNIADGSGNALTSSTRGSQRALSVQIVDGSGNQITSFGSATVDSNLRDGSGNAITSTTSGASRRLDVMLSSGGTTGSAAPANANLVGGTDGTNLRAFSTDTAGKLQTITNNSDLSSLISYDFTGAISTNTILIPSTDVGTYAEASIQAIAFGTSLVCTAQISNDGTNWATAPAQLTSSVTSNPNLTFSTVGLYKIPLFGSKYFRIIASTGASAGTTTLRVYLNPRATTAITQSVAIASSIAMSITPSTGNGFSTHHTAISAASTNATNVKSTTASIGAISISNTSSSIKYFKVFNLTVAPTMGTSSPVLNYAIMPNSTMAIDCGFAGIRLSAGLSYAITSGQALLDNTAVGAGDVVVNISYT